MRNATKTEKRKMIATVDKLFTRIEAAQYIGAAPQTLAIWAMTGRYGLKFIKVGRLCKYRKTDLDKWLESRTVGADTQ